MDFYTMLQKPNQASIVSDKWKLNTKVGKPTTQTEIMQIWGFTATSKITLQCHHSQWC
jgi:hypothetical protein